ncbi:hypothetical protein HDE_05230 [Halotydeus destructor]|nr:hypothetical protein HDE_05230 [Halotydeus destructor]
MSGFNDNSPFGDPFADPSITQVTNNTNTQSGLEDYNPFATQQTKTSTQVRGASNPPDTTVQITPPIETMKAQPLAHSTATKSNDHSSTEYNGS